MHGQPVIKIANITAYTVIKLCMYKEKQDTLLDPEEEGIKMLRNLGKL
jgi:hypothetical protein